MTQALVDALRATLDSVEANGVSKAEAIAAVEAVLTEA